jgi:pantoate--beta-alanine ligase
MTRLSNDSMPKSEALPVFDCLQTMQAQCNQWRSQGLRLAFVPTMGALHEGHLSLVRLASKKADRVLVSIFVNPKQFAQGEDLATYPRQLEDDKEKLSALACHGIYAPDITAMYGENFSTSIHVGIVSEGLCGASRPHFFGGVATVVAKLLNQVRPDIAVFGEKDFQQLLVIRRMVEDLDMGVEIIGGPIIREPDGLAMSSRNAYLGKSERKIAPQFNCILREIAKNLRQGETITTALETGHTQLIDAGFDRVDYLELRSEKNLAPIEAPLDETTRAQARLFGAVILGKTRLIDNWKIER